MLKSLHEGLLLLFAVLAVVGDSKCVPRKVAVTDYPSLMKAISNAAPGDTISMAGGHYSLSPQPIVITTSGEKNCPIRLIGTGANTTLGDVPSTAEQDATITVHASNWVFSDFVVYKGELGILIDNQKGATPADSNDIANVQFKYTTDAAVELRGSRNTVRGLKCLGCYRGVVVGAMQSNNTVFGNVVRNSEFTVSGGAGVVVSLSSTGAAVISNEFWEAAAYSSGGEALIMIGGTDTSVIGNNAQVMSPNLWEWFIYVSTMSSGTFIQSNTGTGSNLDYIALIDADTDVHAVCASNHFTFETPTSADPAVSNYIVDTFC